MENFRMDISFFLILFNIFLCNFINCIGISWTKYTLHNSIFSGHVCSQSRSVSGLKKVSSVSACGRMCYLMDKCLGYFYHPGTHQCRTLSDYPDQACVWTRGQKESPGIFYYLAEHSSIWASDSAVQRENSYYLAGHWGKMSLSQAVDICKRYNATLLEPETPEENKFLKELLLYRGYSEVWLGIADTREEGTWEFLSSGQLVSYSDWGPGEPNNAWWFYHDGTENCATYYDKWNAKWNDVFCTELLNHEFCEKRTEE